MNISKEEIIKAKKRAEKMLLKYGRNDDSRSFKEWMEDEDESLYPEYLNRVSQIDNEINFIKDIFATTEDIEGDMVDVNVKYNKDGQTFTKTNTYSKSALSKKLDKLVEEKPQCTADLFENKLGAYLAARNKVDSRNIFAKIFLFVRTYRESKMLDNMKESLMREYGLGDRQLDKFVDISRDENRLNNTEEILQNGYVNVDEHPNRVVEDDNNLKIGKMPEEEERLIKDEDLDMTVMDDEIEFNPEKDIKTINGSDHVKADAKSTEELTSMLEDMFGDIKEDKTEKIEKEKDDINISIIDPTNSLQ